MESVLTEAVAASTPLSQGELMRLQAQNAQGIRAVQAGTPGLAIAVFEEALTIYEDAGVLSNYGDALARCGRFADAEVAFKRSIDAGPHPKPPSSMAMAWYNLGVVYQQTDRLDEAYEAFAESVKHRITGECLNNLGIVETRRRNIPEAERWFMWAVKERYDDARWNVSLILMMLGKWREAWNLYEYRPQMKELFGNPLRWRGESLEGRTIVVQTEQGLGDSIFAFRYLPVLRDLGAKVVLNCDTALVRLVKSAFEFVQVIDKNAAAVHVPCDYVVAAMSLPGYLSPDGTGPNTPYLAVPRIELPGEFFNVGLCWNGSTAVGAPAERNIPLALLKPLSEIPGVRLISLQKGDGVDEMADCGFEVLDAMATAKDVYDTSQVIASLDLVISIDTLIPHLAGALGVPCWLLNRHASCWQWGTPEHDPHLYSAVAQFRQQARGDWSSPVAHAEAGLKNIATRRRAA